MMTRDDIEGLIARLERELAEHLALPPHEQVCESIVPMESREDELRRRITSTRERLTLIETSAAIDRVAATSPEAIYIADGRAAHVPGITWREH